MRRRQKCWMSLQRQRYRLWRYSVPNAVLEAISQPTAATTTTSSSSANVGPLVAQPASTAARPTHHLVALLDNEQRRLAEHIKQLQNQQGELLFHKQVMIRKIPSSSGHSAKEQERPAQIPLSMLAPPPSTQPPPLWMLSPPSTQLPAQPLPPANSAAAPVHGVRPCPPFRLQARLFSELLECADPSSAGTRLLFLSVLTRFQVTLPPKATRQTACGTFRTMSSSAKIFQRKTSWNQTRASLLPRPSPEIRPPRRNTTTLIL